ncbi:Broad-complex core protein isoforms 1/2/3/4/5-like Protein [Tribolium castaneum]|uniref:Broad-complex core protein isoforms 1/2/3/4/5-like Protein n=1 Tax=Tribolium castaneum TaxID=7070 RepID=D6WY35_TRICA|nr:Broad-complex core protein isoforms 1/2/3/4/5-like Protein [Tribolium castaneum]
MWWPLRSAGTVARQKDDEGRSYGPLSAGGNTRGPDQSELGFAVAGASPKKVFTCQLCGKVLCSKASLKRHIADKHAERQEEYRCVICERVYCSRNSLMTHIYTYHKSRPGDIDIKFF